MVDFFMITTRSTKNGGIEVLPKFNTMKSKDLMTRGGDFLAVWLEEEHRWSTDEDDVKKLIDNTIRNYISEHKEEFGISHIKPMYMWDSDSGSIDRWHKFVQKQCRDNFHPLDENIIFSNQEIKREDYATKRLPYPIEKGDISAWDKLVGTLYSEEERHKIEWAIGAVVNGASKSIQKFLVFYGEAGTGKSTILNIIQKLFIGYWVPFDAKALGSSSAQFALEAFKTNPLVAIQHDGNLSKIEDNTRLNSLVSHETMQVNAKYEKLYSSAFKTFLFMGTNQPVKITDSRSGLLRRLIDVSPTGNKIPVREYNRLVKEVDFELGAIAEHCLNVFENDPDFYDDYVPVNMMGATNDFYNFVVDNFYDFRDMDGITLKAAWERYKTFCDETNEQYPIKYRIFREEFKTYWRNFDERAEIEDGRVRCYYSGFRVEKFDTHRGRKPVVKEEEKSWIIFNKQPYSILDVRLENCPAQYANDHEKPMVKWAGCKTTLKDIDTSKLHYVKPPLNYIVIDFDIPDENGNKSLAKNLEAASKWPATYAELSKSKAGIHLHYIYNGDVDLLAPEVEPHVEIKVFKGNASLRRMLSMCTAIEIATISSGLPIRKEKKSSSDQNVVKDEKTLRMMVQKNLDKEFHGDTSSSINFIQKLLDDAYESGIHYDLTTVKKGEEMSMKDRIIIFAKGSHNQKDRCVKVANAMKFRGKEEELATNKEALDFEKDLIKQIEKELGEYLPFNENSATDTIKTINYILDKAYDSGYAYDVSSMKNSLIALAQGSASKDVAILFKMIQNMHFMGKPNEAEKKLMQGLSDEYDDVGRSRKKSTDGEIIFFDVEVFPNLFVLCWKLRGKKHKVVEMINPKAEEIEDLLKYKLIGFNNRRYDNHILYAKIMGYTNEQLYKLSQKIIKGEKGCFFSEAYNMSYTDIYDFANGDNKTSLKKLEIKMGILHDELGIPWDQPVPEWVFMGDDGHYISAEIKDLDEKSFTNWSKNEDGKVPINLWKRVAEYCCHDVEATEAAFDYLEADWTSRQILADLTGMSVNDTSNTLTTRLIFGNERNTQTELNWRDMGDMTDAVDFDCPEIYDSEWTVFDSCGRPIFPGYKFEMGHSSYRGEDPSEGGYVYAEPGMWGNVALLDIASMHPSSVVDEDLFGKYTENFKELLDARLAIKHEDWNEAEKMFNGKLTPYIQKVKDGEITSKQLANALKIPINSVYGLTSASFSNPFKDDRNKDNIVAKRGALFMINLKNEVQRKGFKVVHIKTDSIKIADATQEIIDFVMEYGRMYGYNFEHEATYERMCLVNDAVYIAKYADGPHKYELPTGEVVETPWTATGKEFQVSYIFKKLFSGDPITFQDYCVTQSCTTALYLDMNEGYPDVTQEEKEWKKLATKYKKGEISDTTWDKEAPILKEAIDKGHNYIFIGKVGQFVPVKEGCGGGVLMREKDGKYYNAAGCSGYRWKSAEIVKSLKEEDSIDISYWDNEAHSAMGDIMSFGDFTWFVSEDPYVGPNYIHGEDMDYPDPEFYGTDDLSNFINVPEELPWKES